MTPRRLLALALLSLLTGCGGGEPSPSTSSTRPTPPSTSNAPTSSTPTPSNAATRPIPRTLTPQDDGSTFTMAVGGTSELLIRAPSAPDPVVIGDAITLIPVVNVTDSGLREWELRATSPGSASISGRSPDFVVTVVVR